MRGAKNVRREHRRGENRGLEVDSTMTVGSDVSQ
jgi:hypothetical protein